MPARPKIYSIIAAVLLGALVGMVGCRAPKDAKNPPPHYVAPKITDLAAPDSYPAVERQAAAALTAVAKPTTTPGKPLNVLALSGGGQYGAFAAGILVGMTEAGTRPTFDVVTGISSGALLSIFAYLGPKYDAQLERETTTLRTGDIFKYRPVPIHLFRDKSLASTEPLKCRIRATLTDEMMSDLQAAHGSGRRLFVATMNLHTRRLVVWDLGAIACSGRASAREEVCQILLATSSIPGIAPAVPIDVDVNGTCVRELHVDGGGVAQTFVRFGANHPQPDPADPSRKWLAGANLYLIAGGKLYIDPTEGEIKFIYRMIGTVSGTLYALYRADLWRLYSLCAVSGMKYHFASVPVDEHAGEGSTAFDPVVQRTLFECGRTFIRSGANWRTTPPGTEPGEEEAPRAGFGFTIP